MNDDQIFERVIHRAIAAGINTTHLDEVIVFLEKEIDSYRGKIDAMQTALNEKCDKINELKRVCNSMYGVGQFSTLEAVQGSTAAEIIKTLSDNGYYISINIFKNDESEGAE